ncbi:glycosyltransferase family A protein [Synoicihabitans lomoniglobus]|uniref:Glycosyltransferase family A protein n=1 Tax=Synoicihabitans lomoniglobus TaxID=2909285 RepID=A0AAF0I635_9BACT|nr:glycosyltransferase family 2 protein [Opitutaceae bacterium LMO-M01]WED67335.1 glycosyltransferase family A protein [Opitutaceae bacterium LMO-M01]
MTAAPLVSILIPAFNAGPWINASVGSAIEQSHERCEIIVVDDGSSDETLARGQKIASRFPDRVKVMSQINAGAAAARNHALRLARGEYIQYLDADDLLSRDKIKLQLEILARSPAHALATCRWGRFHDSPADARFVDDEVFRDFEPIEWIIAHAAHLKMIHPAAWLVPREVAERAGEWDESLTLNDDGEYFARVTLASAGLRFTTDPAAASYYRSGLSGSLSDRKSLTALQSLHHTGELLQSHLFAASDRPETRQAMADHWQHLCYELYPDAPILSRDAAKRSHALGGSTVSPPLGGRQKLVARLFGWRAARRWASIIRR